MPSRKQVKKVGTRVRRLDRGEGSAEDARVVEKVIRSYRAQFSRPLGTTNMAIRRYAEHARVEAEVTQRLKKKSTIIDKLKNRETTLSLDRMQDIGGCRAVVSDLVGLQQLVDTVVDRLGSRVIHHDDYVDKPRGSGYRAHHLVVRSSSDLPIEVQIRTQFMHIWAETVEGFSHELGMNFKQDGEGPMFDFLRAVSDIYWFRETNTPLPHNLIKMYTVRRDDASEFITARLQELDEEARNGQQQLPF